MKPPSGIRIMRQIRVTIVTDRTDDEKKTPRKKAAMRVVRLSNRARISGMTVRGGTVSSTK